MTTSPTPARPSPPKVPRPMPAPVTRSPAVDGLIAALARAGDRTRTAELLRDFWAGITTTPLIEPADLPGHRVVTFLWHQPPDDPSATVYLFVNRLTDERDLVRSGMNRIPGTPIRHLSYLMPDDWRASYCFCPVADDRDLATADQPTLRRWLDGGQADPRNPDTCVGRTGRPMSVVSLPAAPPQPWLAPRPGVPRGEVRRIRVPAAAGWAERTAWIYESPSTGGGSDTSPAIDRPAGRGEDRPTVVLLDGEVWLHRIGVTATFDNLVAEGRIPPVRVVLPDSLGTDIRWRELTARPDTVDALADVLLPAAGATRGTRAVIAGNSLGGLTAVAATLLRPDRFAHAVAMSPSVWWDPDRSGAPWLLRTARRPIPPDAPPVGIELQVGRQEWVLAGPTRELAPVLARPGRTVNLVEYQGGHDFAWWRGGLADALVRWAGGRARR